MVTGYGAVTAHGSGVEPMWQALAEGRSPAIDWSPDDGPETFRAAPIPDDYRPHARIPRNLAHFLDRGSMVGLDAALQAVEAAGLTAGIADSRRFAVADGLAFRAPGQPTLFVPYGQLVARTLGVRGAVVGLAGAEASGLAAIAEAAAIVARGEADVVVAGAAQALQPPVLAHFEQQGLIAPEDAHPLDAHPDGCTPAEGAAYVVVEAETHARERGATVHARIAAATRTFDPLAEPLDPSDPAEAGRAMQAVLGAAGYLQNQVDHVSSCADGRANRDASDAVGLTRTFGRHVYYASVTAPAGALGETLAASGPLALVYALEAMRRQQVAPAAGFREPPERSDLSVVREARDERLDCVLVTSLGLGGSNASVLLQR